MTNASPKIRFQSEGSTPVDMGLRSVGELTTGGATWRSAVAEFPSVGPHAGSAGRPSARCWRRPPRGPGWGREAPRVAMFCRSCWTPSWTPSSPACAPMIPTRRSTPPFEARLTRRSVPGAGCLLSGLGRWSGRRPGAIACYAGFALRGWHESAPPQKRGRNVSPRPNL